MKKPPQASAEDVLDLSVAVIELALYITWTPVGALEVEGVQGRYFLPVLFLLALAQTPFLVKLFSPPARSLVICGLLSTTIFAAHYAVFVAYH